MPKMLGLHIHPDGLIYVRGDVEIWSGPPDDFQADFALPAPVLPDGAVELIYDPGRRTIVTLETGGTMMVAVDPDWDTAIANLSAAVAAKVIRDTPPPPEPPVDPTDTPLRIDDIERLLIGLGVTQAQIDAAKRARP